MTPNSLNQYTSITTGNSRTAIGRAPAAWNVQVVGVNATRAGEIFYRPLTASNTTAPVWQDVVIQRDSGTPTMTRHFWYAAQTFAPMYDDDGNLTNDGRWVYTWNAENRLIQMETTSQATAAGHPYTKLQFAYDWQGHRIARHVWQGGTQVSPMFKSSHRWLYDGWNVVTEFSASSATSTALTRGNSFTWGLDLGDRDGIPRQRAGGVGGLLMQSMVSSGVIERASYDGNGNIVAWTKSTATAPTSRSEYDAFGNTVVSEGVIPNTFGFSAKLQDAETALYYYGYRFYDPVMGRWPSRDSIEEKGGINLHNYINNNAINAVDVLGMQGAELAKSEFEAAKKAGHAAMNESLKEFEEKLADWKKRNKGSSPVVGPREYGGRVYCKKNQADGSRGYFTTKAAGPWPTGIYDGVVPQISPLKMPMSEDGEAVQVSFWHIHPPRWIEKKFKSDPESYYSDGEDFSGHDYNMANNDMLNPGHVQTWVTIYRRSGEGDWITKRTK